MIAENLLRLKCFVLRKAEDALNLCTWVQTHQCKNAIILGVEAADTLRMTGLTTMIIGLSDRLMGRQLDQVLAANIAGEESHYQPLLPPPVQLKMEGIDLRSFGQIEAQADEILITNENKQKHLWLSIVVKAGLIIGGVFVNAPTQANSAMLAAKKNKDITAFIDKIKKGDWSDL